MPRAFVAAPRELTPPGLTIAPAPWYTGQNAIVRVGATSDENCQKRRPDVDGILCQPAGGRGAFAPPAGNRPGGAFANRGRGGRARRSATPPNPRVENPGGPHILRGAGRKIPAGLPLVPAGYGPERHPQNQQVQRPVQILLRLWHARPHRPHRRRLLGNWRQQISRGGHRPAALHPPRAHGHFLCVPRAVHGNRGVLWRHRQIPRGGHPPAHVHQRHPSERGKPARAGERRAGRAALQPGGARIAQTA